MDSRLQIRLEKWNKYLERMKAIEEAYLQLEASEKSFFSELFLKQEGPIAEKNAKVYASNEWKSFERGLAHAKSEYNHSKRAVELRAKAFDAEYLTFKLDNELIRKHI